MAGGLGCQHGTSIAVCSKNEKATASSNIDGLLGLRCCVNNLHGGKEEMSRYGEVGTHGQ